MEKQSLRFASDGDPSLLTLEVPAEYSRSGEEIACVAFPVLARRGGLTLAVPLSAFDPEKLVDELQRSEEGLVGPSKSFVTDLVIEDDSGNPVVSEHRCRFLVVDFDDTVLALLSEFNAETDPDRTVPFDADVPGGLPVADGLAEEVRTWAGGLNVGRVVFYSAREETDAPGAKSWRYPKESCSQEGHQRHASGTDIPTGCSGASNQCYATSCPHRQSLSRLP